MIIPKGYDQEMIEYFINGFLAAALFAERDEHDEPLDSNFGIYDFEENSLERIKDDCLSFMALAGDLLEPTDLEQSGMDCVPDGDASGHLGCGPAGQLLDGVQVHHIPNWNFDSQL